MKLRSVLTASFIAIITLALAACGAASGGTPAQPGTSQTGISAPSTSTPSQITWKIGGTYEGPWPPDRLNLPQPFTTWDLGDYTSSQGYHVRGFVRIWNALHYSIPRMGFDAMLGPSGSQDLPPGKYVVPFSFTLVNLNHQQCPAGHIQIWASLPDGTQLQVTGQAGSRETWDNGSDMASTLEGYHAMENMYGLVGPASADELLHATFYAAWTSNSNPVLAKTIATLTPNRALPSS